MIAHHARAVSSAESLSIETHRPPIAKLPNQSTSVIACVCVTVALACVTVAPTRPSHSVSSKPCTHAFAPDDRHGVNRRATYPHAHHRLRFADPHTTPHKAIATKSRSQALSAARSSDHFFISEPDACEIEVDALDPCTSPPLVTCDGGARGRIERRAPPYLQASNLAFPQPRQRRL